jgi:two-component system CheB/CheR fusion protein
VAILLLEQAARQEVRPQIQVFGTDLDVHALAAAREGRFPVAIEADVSEVRLRQFFTREGDYYRVRQELRDIILFALHDLIKDPPFSRVDLVSCRNVLIYLDRDLQEQVCGTFHYALNPGGYLFLGTAETADFPAGYFRTTDRPARIYQSTLAPGAKPDLLPRLTGPIRVRETLLSLPQTVSPMAALSEAAAHRRALEQIAPPSILVDERHRVLHLSDGAGRYLLPPGGPLSTDIADLVRPELRFEMRSALHRTFEKRGWPAGSGANEGRTASGAAPGQAGSGNRRSAPCDDSLHRGRGARRRRLGRAPRLERDDASLEGGIGAHSAAAAHHALGIRCCQ